MDDGSATVIGLVAAGLVGLIVVGGGLLYLMDFGVEATVVSKACPDVTVETSLGGFEVTRDAGAQCGCADVGDTIVYHIRSGELTYENTGGGLC